MTSFEVGMWVAGGLFLGALIFGGIGAHFGEQKQTEAENAFMMLAAALLGMSAISAGKSFLSLII